MPSDKIIPFPVLPLSSLRAGQRGNIVSVSEADKDLYQKLSSMGAVSGTLVEVLRFAPLGDPVAVRLRGYELALRRDEAARIMVTPE